jgi:hypothetical protein
LLSAATDIVIANICEIRFLVFALDGVALCGMFSGYADKTGNQTSRYG